MRLWSLHPRYLDARGLVALWREGLLARAVLAGCTRGYRHHPQLERFRAQRNAVAAIDRYLRAVHAEALHRGYSFDVRKLGPARRLMPIPVARGQLRHEWRHLLRKLKARSPNDWRRWRALRNPRCHPAFAAVRGGVEGWERG